MPTPLDDRRTAAVIWIALVFGCLLFFGVVAFLRATGSAAERQAPELLVWLALAVPVLLVALSYALPPLVKPAGPPEGVARVRLLVGWALREGGSMFATAVWLVSGDAKAVAGFAIAIAALAASGPTEGRWRAAVEAASGRPGRPPMVR